MPGKIKSVVLIILKKNSFEKINNDYNAKFLPKTEFIDFSFLKKKVDFDSSEKGQYNYFYNILNLKYSPLYSFYIEKFEENILITTKGGNIYKIKIEDLLKNKKKLKKNKIKNNLKLNNILDSLVINNQLFISGSILENDCNKMAIYYSDIRDANDQFHFRIFKKFDECSKTKVGAGRMKPFEFNFQKGIIISTSTAPKIIDKLGASSQDDNSIFGKTLFINSENKNHFIYSKGHRNIQGLDTKKKIILATEHGPRGGDELNSILLNENYGWPIASYGEAYDNEIKYLKSHSDNGFKEPLFAFVPSIGISELIIVPKEFNDKWINSVLVSSLNGKSIYRLQFQSQNYQRIVYTEKIYIGQRIRDITYIDKKKVFLLALENLGEIGILQ